ncbi:hypothetical protein TNCV_1848771 [Trichonephila clavipes]|nr:hypothetical protein TNCV_1848771 [Trichonephila clavipes]
MMLKAVDNDRRNLALFHDEFRGPRSDTVDQLHCTASFTLGSWVISHRLDSLPSAVPLSFLRSSPRLAGALLR